MGELMQKRQNATTWEEKDKIDHQILDKHIECRNSIRNLLNDQQKIYFDQNYGKKFGKGNMRQGHPGQNNRQCNKQCNMYQQQ